MNLRAVGRPRTKARLGDSRAQDAGALWSCNGMVMSALDKANFMTAQFPVNKNCVPINPAPDPTPAPSGPSVPFSITQTSIQTPTQSQTSGQDTGIGNKTDGSASLLDGLAKILTAVQPSQSVTAPPSSSTVTVSTSPTIDTPGDFFAKYKLWILGGGAVLAFLYAKKNKLI